MKSLLTHKSTEPQLIFRHNICSTGYFSGGLLCVFSNYNPVHTTFCHLLWYHMTVITMIVAKPPSWSLNCERVIYITTPTFSYVTLFFISLFRPFCMSFPAADQARPPPIPTSLVHQTHQAYAIMPKYGTSPDPQYWITIPPSTPSHPHYIWPRLMSVSGCRWSEERCRAPHYQNLGPWSGSQGIKRKNRSKELDHHFQAASWFICIWVSFCRTGFFAVSCYIFFYIFYILLSYKSFIDHQNYISNFS